MKTKIFRVHYSSLRNSEFTTVYNQLIAICEKHDIPAFHLDKSYGELISYRPKLSSLEVYLRKNDKLEAVGKIDHERDILTNITIHVVKAYSVADLQEIKPHCELLETLLIKHNAKTIASDSRAAETERLKKLETDVNANANIQIALSVLGLTPVVGRLFAANHEYDSLFKDYIAEKGAEQHINIPLLRQDCTKSVTQFIDAVEYSAYIYEDIDYMPFVNELNKLNQYYSQQLKARATRRKNGNKTEEEQAIQPMEGEN
jgi:hypothetical protein